MQICVAARTGRVRPCAADGPDGRLTPVAGLLSIHHMTSALAVELRDQPGTPSDVPQRIGRFLVREEIGRGSNGVVYAATDPVLGRDVAIKAIPLHAPNPGQQDVEAGFLQEAKIAAGLNHPSIVTVFDAGKTDSIAYIAMERLTGSDLHHWLAQNHTMSAESAAALIARVSDAVHFAHRRGLIHRDIKPSNIFLGRDMKPKVLDFGIALAQAKQGKRDDAGKLIGTPNYMSPEQAMGRPLDARSDVFSIGAILYELIAGHRAFDGATIDEILTKVVKIDPPMLSSWRPEISPVIGDIVFRALAKDPADRYQTAAQLRNDLAAFAGRPVSPATSPPGDFSAVPPRALLPRTPLHLPGTGALIATGIAIAGLTLTFALWIQSHRSNAETASAAAAAAAERPVTPGNPAADALRPAATPPRSEPAPIATAGAGSAATAAAAGNETNVRPAARAPARARGNSRTRALAATAIPAPPPTPPVPAAPAEPGSLALAIVPWGEVLVDGNNAGISPPLTRLDLAPGSHSIEIRNGGTVAFVTRVDIASGKTFVLQHRF